MISVVDGDHGTVNESCVPYIWEICMCQTSTLTPLLVFSPKHGKH